MSEHASYCRICAAACGITVEVEGERVVRVRGDRDHPASRGYVCGKGRGLADWHHRADRLDEPRLRGLPVTWSDALGDLAEVITATMEGSGPDAVGLYLATGLAYDAAGQMAATGWLRAIGSRAFYTAATVDNAPVLVATQLVTGNAALNPVWDPTSPGLLVMVGTNPVISHGYGTTIPDPVRYLRDYRKEGGVIWTIDPRRTETAALSDAHLAIRPGSDVFVLAAVASALLADGADLRELSDHCRPSDVDALRSALAPFTIERAADVSDVDPAQIEALVAQLRAHRGRLAMFCGTGTTMSQGGVLTEWLRWVLLILTGSLDRQGGMRFHDGVFKRPRAAVGPERPPTPGPASRPELTTVAGQMPAVALADEIDAGNLQVLVVTGGNPLTALPEPDRLRSALPKLAALVVVDVVESELAALATHVLPATGQLERADITLLSQVSVRSAVQSTPAVVAPSANRRPAWWAFATIAARMGLDVLGGEDPDSLDDTAYLRRLVDRSPLGGDAILDGGPHGLPVPVEVGWVRPLLPDGVWRIAPQVLLERLAAHPPPDGDLVLIPRRDAVWNNSIRYARSGEERVVRLHPRDAERAGVDDGDEAQVTSVHGQAAATVAIDESLRQGVVSMSHGRRDQNPGGLTSLTVEVDPLTAMPHASGVPVTVSLRTDLPGDGAPG